jgi:hypothetical protein
MNSLKIFLTGLMIAVNMQNLFPQEKLSLFYEESGRRKMEVTDNAIKLKDTIKQKTKTARFSSNAIFISAGGGLNVPVVNFNANSNATFGILGRLEFGSTLIFPFVIGGEVDYFSYNGADLFKTTNLLTKYTTRILSFGMNIEYVLSKFFSSSYTMPFITIDVKSNSIKREYDETANLPELARAESKISVGAGLGFTLFVFDFYAKYNYMKDLQNFGVYAKVKFPLIRF